MIKYIYIFMSWVYCADFVPSLFSKTRTQLETF